jgi:hypothetical protein
MYAVTHNSDTLNAAVAAAAALPGHITAIRRLQDIVETPAAFELHCDAPGFNPDDVSVEMNEGVLTISGKRKEEKQEEREGKVRSTACTMLLLLLQCYGCFQNILAAAQQSKGVPTVHGGCVVMLLLLNECSSFSSMHCQNNTASKTSRSFQKLPA